MEQVRVAFAGLDALAPKAAGERHQARHALKHGLIRTRDCTADEARRIAVIPERAMFEIFAAIFLEPT